MKLHPGVDPEGSASPGTPRKSGFKGRTLTRSRVALNSFVYIFLIVYLL